MWGLSGKLGEKQPEGTGMTPLREDGKIPQTKRRRQMAVSKTTAKKPATRRTAKAATAKGAGTKDKAAVMKAAAAAAEPAARKAVKIVAEAPARQTATAEVSPAGTASEAGAAKPAKQKLTKEDFVSAVAERAGVKRGEAKPVIEAALELLGEAIAAGRMLNLPGLGKIKVVRTRKLTGEKVFVTRIRQRDEAAAPEGDTPGKDPLAEAAE